MVKKMVESGDWDWIDELLKEFGSDHFGTLGLECKISAWGCTSCEFFAICTPKSIENKLRYSFDVVGDKLEKDRLPKVLKVQEFRFGSKREIPKAIKPFWLREKENEKIQELQRRLNPKHNVLGVPRKNRADKR